MEPTTVHGILRAVGAAIGAGAITTAAVAATFTDGAFWPWLPIACTVTVLGGELLSGAAAVMAWRLVCTVLLGLALGTVLYGVSLVAGRGVADAIAVAILAVVALRLLSAVRVHGRRLALLEFNSAHFGAANRDLWPMHGPQDHGPEAWRWWALAAFHFAECNPNIPVDYKTHRTWRLWIYVRGHGAVHIDAHLMRWAFLRGGQRVGQVI
jgi:hypothetical protein